MPTKPWGPAIAPPGWANDTAVGAAPQAVLPTCDPVAAVGDAARRAGDLAQAAASRGDRLAEAARATGQRAEVSPRGRREEARVDVLVRPDRREAGTEVMHPLRRQLPAGAPSRSR
jgi:hypothetical protein